MGRALQVALGDMPQVDGAQGAPDYTRKRHHRLQSTRRAAAGILLLGARDNMGGHLPGGCREGAAWAAFPPEKGPELGARVRRRCERQ